MELKGQGWATLKMTDAEMETICAMHCYTFHVIKQFQKVKLFAIHNSWVRRDDSCPMEQPPPLSAEADEPSDIKTGSAIKWRSSPP